MVLEVLEVRQQGGAPRGGQASEKPGAFLEPGASYQELPDQETLSVPPSPC